MSVYDNDPRVVKKSDNRYELPSPEGWHVYWNEGLGEWQAVAANERYSSPAYYAAATADAAIRMVIGDPQ